eukprot:TRINITY_DN33318_c0_g1_i1.p1 TRINITY_DN33318_c0_g1~~TRINITY_DN33318_c0_g1_i1.p1  ORF type:complete len:552 (-),score=82.52 TRINITY_DN33318_c0_g1_i1:107-1762(-)
MQESSSAARIPDPEASPKRVRWQSGPSRFPDTFNLKFNEVEENDHLLKDDSESTVTTSASLPANAYPSLTLLHHPLEDKSPQQVLECAPVTRSVSTSEFWLVVSAEVLDTDDVKETFKLKFFTKWFMHCPDFPRLVRSGERKLELNGAVITKEQAECKSIASSGASGREDETCLEYWARRLEGGERLPGLAIMGAESNAFPVNPDHILLNSMGEQQEIMSPWLRYDPASGVVSTQYAFTTCLKISMRVGSFPYDRHLIPMKLSVRAWKEHGVQHRWVLAQNIPKWLDPEKHLPFPEDRSIVSVRNPPDDDEFDWNLKPFPYHGEKTILYLRIARDPAHFLTTAMLPIFVVVLLAQGSLFLKGDGGDDDNDTRFNACMASLLTVSAYKSSVQSSLPKKQYMTFADWYFVMVFFFHGAFVLKILVVIHLYGSKRAGTFDDSQRANESHFIIHDDSTTWALIAVWIVFHAFFAIDRCFGFCLSESVGLRKSWATLLQERAPHDSKDRWCHGVNGMPGNLDPIKSFSYFGSKTTRLAWVCCCRQAKKSTAVKDTE